MSHSQSVVVLKFRFRCDSTPYDKNMTYAEKERDSDFIGLSTNLNIQPNRNQLNNIRKYQSCSLICTYTSIMYILIYNRFVIYNMQLSYKCHNLGMHRINQVCHLQLFENQLFKNQSFPPIINFICWVLEIKELRDINQRKHLKTVDVYNFKTIVIQKEFHK